MSKTNNDTFSTYSPIINFLFFIGAIVCGMFFIHPAFLLCSVVSAAAYYFTIKRRAALKLIVGMLPLFIFMSVLNPLLNTNGSHVLFTYFNGRPYTLEALYYGMALAAMFLSVIIWFACYNAVMTGDKFIYLFGRLAPSVSLVFTMVLRLIPNYRRKAGQIAGARKCIGKSVTTGTRRERAESGLTIVSSLTSWALEGGIVTADSMRSRGYGCGKRSSFSIYRFEGRDKLLLILMAAALSATIACALMGGTKAAYTPVLYISGTDNIYTVAGAVFYGIFLLIPSILNVREEIAWNILRSRI